MDRYCVIFLAHHVLSFMTARDGVWMNLSGCHSSPPIIFNAFFYFVVYSRNADAEFYYSEGIMPHTAPDTHTHITAATIQLYKQPMKIIDMLSLRGNLNASVILHLVTLAIIMSNSDTHEVLSKQISNMNYGFDLYIKSTDDVHFASQCKMKFCSVSHKVI